MSSKPSDNVLAQLHVQSSDRDISAEHTDILTVVRPLSIANIAHSLSDRHEPSSTPSHCEELVSISPEGLPLRAYVPRSGAGTSAGVPAKVVPRAPIGIPVDVAAPMAELTPKQLFERQDRIRLENSRTRKWLSMLACPMESSAAKSTLKKRCRKGIPVRVRCINYNPRCACMYTANIMRSSCIQDGVRGAAWFYLVGAATMRAAAVAAGEPSYAELLDLHVPPDALECSSSLLSKSKQAVEVGLRTEHADQPMCADPPVAPSARERSHATALSPATVGIHKTDHLTAPVCLMNGSYARATT
jgi:hypothetical protein